MSCVKKMVIEVMFKAQYCLICVYMDEAIREILPQYEHFVEYRRVDILKGEGKKRFWTFQFLFLVKMGSLNNCV